MRDSTWPARLIEIVSVAQRHRGGHLPVALDDGTFDAIFYAAGSASGANFISWWLLSARGSHVIGERESEEQPRAVERIGPEARNCRINFVISQFSTEYRAARIAR